MKIERVNGNKIRFTLDREDLEKRDIQISELSYGSEKAKVLFEELMEMARDELGYDVEAKPLMVEAIPTPGDGLIINVSSVEDPEELDPRFSRFTNGLEYDNHSSGPDSDGPDDMQEPFPGWEGADYEGDGFTDIDGPGGPGGPENTNDKNGPDGIQIRQGPEIRAEFSIPKSSEIDPKDIMSMIDSIVSGIAGKVGAEVRKVSGNAGPGQNGPAAPGSTAGPHAPGAKKPQGKTPELTPDPFALFEFKDLQSVIRSAKLISTHYDSENILYKNPVNQRYYLYLGHEKSSLEEFAMICATLNEFGNRCRISYATREYFEEHMTVILRDALVHLEELV